MKRIGIIGAGMIAERHIENFQKTKRAEVTWLADISKEALKEVSEKFKILNTTQDYKDILNSDAVDAVVICTPPSLHKSMFIESLHAGKNVLVEKPVAMNIEDVDEMIAEKNKFPQLAAMDCSARHSRLTPKFRKVKEIIDTGKLGEIYFIHHNSIWRNGRPGIEYHPKAKWFMNKKLAGGGPLFDWGVYDLSFHLGLLGDKPELMSVNDVILKSGLDDFDPGDSIYDVEEMFVVTMKMSNGLKYYWERGNHANVEVPNETRIYGTRGGIKVGFCSWDSNVIKYYDIDESGKSRENLIEVDMSDHSDELALADHFIDVLEGKSQPILSLEVARKHMAIIFDCYKAAN